MTMTIKEIEQAITDRSYEYVGLRVEDGVTYNIGDAVNPSRVWVDGDPTDEMLDGSSCIGIRYASDAAKVLRMMRMYYGDKMYLIAGDRREYGEDEGEYIIANAVVIGIVQ